MNFLFLLKDERDMEKHLELPVLAIIEHFWP